MPPMRKLIETLGSLLSGSAAALGNLRKRLTESRPDVIEETRLEALESAMEIQATLNESVDVQIKLIYAMLEKVQKRLQILTIVLIATATLAALALAAAWMR
jgi:hypothetical protein